MHTLPIAAQLTPQALQLRHQPTETPAEDAPPPQQSWWQWLRGRQEGLLLYSPRRHGPIDRFPDHPDYPRFTREFKDLMLRLRGLDARTGKPVAGHPAGELLPRQREQLTASLKAFDANLFDADSIRFVGQKALVFRAGKERFARTCDLMDDQSIPLERRKDALRNLPEQLAMCQGGVAAALEEALCALTGTGRGLAGQFARAKEAVAMQLLIDYVRSSHGPYQVGDETHIAQHYAARLADSLGIARVADGSAVTGRTGITEAMAVKCRDAMHARLQPGLIAREMAREYLSLLHQGLATVKDAQGRLLDPHAPIAAENVGAVSQRLRDLEEQLRPRFGKVNAASLLSADADGNYRFAAHPDFIAADLLASLVEQGLVEGGPLLLIGRRDGTGSLALHEHGGLVWACRGNASGTHPDEGREAISTAHLEAFPIASLRRLLEQSPPHRLKISHVLDSIAMECLHNAPAGDLNALSDGWLAQIGVLRIMPKLATLPPARHAELLRRMIVLTLESPRGPGRLSAALMAAAQLGMAYAVAMLLGIGTDPDTHDGHGGDALSLALGAGHTGVLSLLLSRRSPPIASVRALAAAAHALRHAMGRGHHEAVGMFAQCLVRLGWPEEPLEQVLGVADAGGRTGLHAALRKGHVETVRAFAEVVLGCAALSPAARCRLLEAATADGRPAINAVLQKPPLGERQAQAILALIDAVLGSELPRAYKLQLFAAQDPGDRSNAIVLAEPPLHAPLVERMFALASDEDIADLGAMVLAHYADHPRAYQMLLREGRTPPHAWLHAVLGTSRLPDALKGELVNPRLGARGARLLQALARQQGRYTPGSPQVRALLQAVRDAVAAQRRTHRLTAELADALEAAMAGWSTDRFVVVMFVLGIALIALLMIGLPLASMHMEENRT